MDNGKVYSAGAQFSMNMEISERLSYASYMYFKKMRAPEPSLEKAGGLYSMIAKLSFFSSFVHEFRSRFDSEEEIMRLIVGEEVSVEVDEADEEDGALRYERSAAGPAQRKDVINAIPVSE